VPVGVEIATSQVLGQEKHSDKEASMEVARGICRITTTTALVAALLVTGLPGTGGAGVVIEEYAVGGGGPTAIAAGPDGNVWFATNWGDVGLCTPSGSITVFDVPDASTSITITAITLGPDGNLWFTEYNQGTVGKVTPAGDITEYPLASPSDTPTDIATGPDGNLWFSMEGGSIGRIRTDGILLGTLTPPWPASAIEGLTLGPDGNVWFTTFGRIGRVTPGGVFRSFRTMQPRGGEYPINAVGGNLWYVKVESNIVGRITTKGAVREYRVAPQVAGGETWLTDVEEGPDGNPWVTGIWPGYVARIGRHGEAERVYLPSAQGDPWALVTGPDNRLWVAERGAGLLAGVAF